MNIRNIVLRRVARIELETHPALRKRLGHFVVIGGGFSGVETAGELIDCLESIHRYYPRVGASELKVTVLQDRSRLLLELSERLGRAADCSIRGARSAHARGQPARDAVRTTHQEIRLPRSGPDGGDRTSERCCRPVRRAALGIAGVAPVARLLPLSDAHLRPQASHLRRMALGHVLSQRHHPSALY